MTNADRSLVPVAVSQFLGLPLRELAAWMRDADIHEPLTVAKVKRWRAHPHETPVWLRDQMAWKRAKREQQRQTEQDARQVLLDQTYRDVVRMLTDHDRKLRQDHWLDRHDDHALMLADIAWRASKDCGLASGEANPDWWALTYEEREALRISGYRLPPEPDPNKVASLRSARDQRSSRP